MQNKGGEGPEMKEESSRESLNLLREYQRNAKENVGGNMDSKGHSDEVSDGKGNLFYYWKLKNRTSLL